MEELAEREQPGATAIENRSSNTETLTLASNSMNQMDLINALEVVERDSLAIAESYCSLFASLRLALSQVTSTSVDHLQCFNDAAGRVQESAIDAAARGNGFIHSCIRLNEEMKGVDDLATKLKILRRNVDALDNAVNHVLRIT